METPDFTLDLLGGMRAYGTCLTISPPNPTPPVSASHSLMAAETASYGESFSGHSAGRVRATRVPAADERIFFQNRGRCGRVCMGADPPGHTRQHQLHLTDKYLASVGYKAAESGLRP
ncbi:hypothetical protein CW304_32140 [Bacillus sp. UFRGS-B20]|nr:hypothetical protein CW304_32140 [Bacillus sp. UFRGS-B20]